MFFLCGEDWQTRELFCRTDLPSKQSVHGMLKELFTENKDAKAGDTIEANHYHQSKDWDIKVSPDPHDPTHPPETNPYR